MNHDQPPLSGTWKQHIYVTHHKLAASEVLAIRAWAVTHPGRVGHQARTLAPIFGVAPETIVDILKRRSWIHLAAEG